MNILNTVTQNKKHSGDCGVLYVADSTVFPGLQISSCSSDYPVCVVDIGLTDEQIKWCDEYEIQVIRYVGIVPDIPHWQTWLKASALLLTPFKYTLYLDTDTLCTNSLTQAFDYIKNNGLLIVDDEAKWYQHDKYIEYAKHYTAHTSYDERYVNAGVIGYSHDHMEFIHTYQRLCQECFDNELYHIYSWFDEGCLNRCLDIHTQYTSTSEYKYNRLSPVIPCLTESLILCSESEKITHMKYNFLYSYTTYKKFITNKNISNDNIILHFRGTTKPWMIWSKNQYC